MIFTDHAAAIGNEKNTHIVAETNSSSSSTDNQQDDKFALPLHITIDPEDETALSPKDVNSTPRNEQNGCPVVVVDRQLLFQTPSMCDAKVCAQTLQESKLATGNGYVGVTISEPNSSLGVPTNYQHAMEDIRRIMASCWGMICQGVHLVAAAKTPLVTMTATLAMYLASIFHFDFFRVQSKMNFVSSREEELMELQKYVAQAPCKESTDPLPVSNQSTKKDGRAQRRHVSFRGSFQTKSWLIQAAMTCSVASAFLAKSHTCRHQTFVMDSGMHDMGNVFQDDLVSAQPRPIPMMPSPMFQELAASQLEFLANAMASTQRQGSSKVKSMALYFPQENSVSGQLEFTPVVLYPRRDRVFIAPEADSGLAPTLPASLTKLPGFSHAKSLIPGYPMVSSPSFSESGGDSLADGSVGLVEEVLCDLQSQGACALSVPLFSGVQTVGVLLVSPADVPENPDESVWSEHDRLQVARAARSLSLALNMDEENQAVRDQNVQIAETLSDSLHQVKNPLQALRTYGKLLQQQIASNDVDANPSNYVQGSASKQQRRLLDLADHMMVQSERLTRRLEPVDSVVELLNASKERPALLPAKQSSHSPLALLPSQSHSGTGSAIRSVGDSSMSSMPAEIYPSNAPDDKDALNSPAGGTADLELQMAFVPDVLEPIFSAFRAIAEDRRVQFQVYDESDELPGVHTNPESLQEVLSNVLDNAFKYVILGKFQNDFNPTPEVRVFLLPNDEERHESGVTIVVTDNGPGISPQVSQRIFKRGYRVDSTQDRADGQGLGLFIARSLIEATGGQLVMVHGDNKRQLDQRVDKKLLDGATMQIVLYRKP